MALFGSFALFVTPLESVAAWVALLESVAAWVALLEPPLLALLADSSNDYNLERANDDTLTLVDVRRWVAATAAAGFLFLPMPDGRPCPAPVFVGLAAALVAVFLAAGV